MNAKEGRGIGLSRKEWLDYRSKKYKLKKYRRKRKKRFNSKVENFNNPKVPNADRYGNYDIGWGVYDEEVPQNFSFINNIDETIEYFSKIINEIKLGKFKKTFIIDSKNVNYVTIDALAYLISIMRNIKINKINQHTFKGSLPKEEAAKEVYLESGFFKYVKSKQITLPKSNEKMQIVTGKTTDQAIAKNMCVFVMEKLKVDRLFTSTLYKTLIELMSNAVHHAYNSEDELMFPCWYLYAEYFGGKVRIIFIDTGLGIANTVRKNFFEKIGVKKSGDADLILSALNGDFRTETGKKNRGLGLPAIKKFVVEGEISNFFVLSGRGSCRARSIGGRNILGKFEHNNNIYGTVYSFEIGERS